MLAEPLAGTGQTQPGRVGADAKRQASFGGTQLPVGNQLQDLAIPDRHGPQRRLDMGRLPRGVDRRFDGLVLLAGVWRRQKIAKASPSPAAVAASSS
jgi:hypothetical protein